MSVINTNVNAIIARNASSMNERVMTKAMQQLSTGKRINVAADDAAGLAISTKMTSQIKGLDQAIRNANDGISMLQVVEGATVEMTNMLQRMRELAVQSANDTNSSQERSYLNDEFQQLRSEIDRIADSTQWNGVNVMDGSNGLGTDNASGTVGGQTMKFQVGANNAQYINFDIANFKTSTATPTVTEVNFGAAAAAIDHVTVTLGGAAQTNVGFTAFAAVTGASTIAEWETNAANVQSALRSDSDMANFTVTATAVGVLEITDPSGRTVTAAWDASGTADAAVIATTSQVGVPGGTGVFSTAALNTQSVATQSGATTAVTKVDDALSNLNSQRSAIGATINRLTYAADNLTNTSANVSAARSRVLDTDYAQATTELARSQIIQQASTAMLAQANQGAQSVLSLLK
jgi:flagellin